jgi:hypothetical protein
VDCWSRKQEDGTRKLTPLLDQMRLNGREVVIIYDSEVATKRQVKRSAYQFQGALQDKGASVKFVVLPSKSDNSKQGLDDFLLDPERGPDALADLIEAARPVPKPSNCAIQNFEEYEVPKKGGETKIERAPIAADTVLADIMALTDNRYPVAVGAALWANDNGELRMMPTAPISAPGFTRSPQRGARRGLDGSRLADSSRSPSSSRTRSTKLSATSRPVASLTSPCCRPHSMPHTCSLAATAKRLGGS